MCQAHRRKTSGLQAARCAAVPSSSARTDPQNAIRRAIVKTTGGAERCRLSGHGEQKAGASLFWEIGLRAK